MSLIDQADVNRCLALVEQWDAAKAAHSQWMATREAKVQRAQSKTDAANAAKDAHDFTVCQQPYSTSSMKKQPSPVTAVFPTVYAHKVSVFIDQHNVSFRPASRVPASGSAKRLRRQSWTSCSVPSAI